MGFRLQAKRAIIKAEKDTLATMATSDLKPLLDQFASRLDLVESQLKIPGGGGGGGEAATPAAAGEVSTER